MAVAIVCALGLALRLLVAYLGHGSNDIDTWQRFAALVRRHGVLRSYELEPKFNHPPLMGYYAAFVDQSALALGLASTSRSSCCRSWPARRPFSWCSAWLA